MTADELIAKLKSQDDKVRTDTWFGAGKVGAPAIGPLSRLEHIPGDRSLAALKAGLAAAPDDFKFTIAQSLRQRGEEVPGVPCVKLVPTRKTSVKPAGG